VVIQINATDFTLANWRIRQANEAEYNHIMFRHADKCNMTFFDGHVELLSVQQITVDLGDNLYDNK
jgi:prepilin-type processing-associated H-X9-DG protein